MKIRNGFVTNSSSSSFIISKTQNFNSKEEVYQFMRNEFREWKNKVTEMIKFCRSDKRFKVSKKDGYTKIEVVGHKVCSDEWDKLNEMMVDKFGIELWDNLDYDTSWIDKYDNYEDFRNYCETNPNSYDTRYPFEIVDMTSTDSSNDEEYSKEIIGWYIPCYDEEDENYVNRLCEYCSIKDKCHEDKNKVRNIETRANTIKGILNGRFVVYSECGYIPDGIVEKLRSVSTLSCNHMG